MGADELEHIKIELTQQQRESFLSATGRRVKSVTLSTRTGIAFPDEIECKKCLLSTRFDYVNISDDGLCNVCESYIIQSSENRDEQVEKFFQYNSDDRVVLAFSGGKDSAMALVIAVEVLKLKPIALLIDNGFIPDSVISQAKTLCDSLNVPLVVNRIDIYSRVRNSLLNYFMSPAPCQICIVETFKQISNLCHELGITKVIGGHRYPPFIYTLDEFTGLRRDKNISCISILMWRKISESEQLAVLTKYGFKRKDISGNSTNCILLGYVEDIFYNRFGFSPHIEEVSREIRSGFITREEGLNKIRRPNISDELKKEISSKLSID